MSQQIFSNSASQAALDRLIASPEFANSSRLVALLRFLADASLAGNTGPFKETVLGVEVFGRPADYDPKLDSVVRTEVRRLRLKLAEYYAGSGSAEPIQIEIPKGAYQVVFVEKSPLSAPEPLRPKRFSAYFLLLFILPVLAALYFWIPRSPSSLAVEPKLLTPSIGQATHPSISADGRLIAYAYANGDESGIYLLGSGSEPKRLPGTRVRDFHPAISPDGQTIAFLRELEPDRFELLVQPLNAATPQRWALLPRRDRLCWLPDSSRIIAPFSDAPGQPTHLRIISPDGPGPILTSPPAGVLYDGYPVLAPDASSLAFIRATESSVDEIYLLPLDRQHLPQSAPRKLTAENQHFTGFDFAPDGRSLIASLHRPQSSRGLYRIPLDSPAQLSRIAGASISAAYPAVAAHSGRTVYSVGIDDINIYSIKSGTPAQPVSHSNAIDSAPSLSPDATRFAFRSARSGTSEIWTVSLNGSSPKRLTSHNGPTTGSPRWSPDGRWIAYDTRLHGNGDVYLISADGAVSRRITATPANEVVPSWSADGRFLYFASDQTGSWQIWRLPIKNGQPDGLPLQFTSAGGFRSAASPDNDFLYYSKRGLSAGIWRKPTAGGPESQVLTLPERLGAAWALSRNGLYFTANGDQPKLFFLPFNTSTPRLLHQASTGTVYWEASVAVAADDSVILFCQLDRAISDLYEIQIPDLP